MNGLTMTSLHPASMHSLSCDLSVMAVAARIGISFASGLERIWRVASRPSMPGIIMSMKIRSGFSLMAFSTPSLPLLAEMSKGTLLPKGLYGSWLRCLGKRDSMRMFREGKEY